MAKNISKDNRFALLHALNGEWEEARGRTLRNEKVRAVARSVQEADFKVRKMQRPVSAVELESAMEKLNRL